MSRQLKPPSFLLAMSAVVAWVELESCKLVKTFFLAIVCGRLTQRHGAVMALPRENNLSVSEVLCYFRGAKLTISE